MNETVQTGMQLAAGVAIVYIVASVVSLLLMLGLFYLIFRKFR